MERKPKTKRKGRRSRLKTARDKLIQLQQIENAQLASRQRTIRVKIDSIEKSKPRLRNSLQDIRNAEDALREFE